MKIYRVTPDDALDFAKVHNDSWRSAYNGLVPDTHLDNLEYEKRAQQLRKSLTHSSGEPYVFKQNGEVFGFLTLGTMNDT